jgi:hypothetical protein
LFSRVVVVMVVYALQLGECIQWQLEKKLGAKQEAQLEGGQVLVVMEGVRSVQGVAAGVAARLVQVWVLKLVPVQVAAWKGAGIEWLVEVVVEKCRSMARC